VDKVYKPKNLALAWEKVKGNRGAGGIDRQTIEAFEAGASVHLQRLHDELVGDAYKPQPVRQQLIPKAGQPGKFPSAGHSHGLRPGVPAGVAQPAGADLRAVVR
jgi:RNA-directed DNA polymerase